MAKTIVEKDIPRIKELLINVIGDNNILQISRGGGLTNHTYFVELKSGKYVVRIPGEGTEELINRHDEEISTRLACNLGIDAKLLHFGEDGSKVTEYIQDAVTMSSDSMKKTENIVEVANIFKKLHSCGIDTGVSFEVFDMAKGYETIIGKYNVSMPDDYAEIKEHVMKIKEEIDTTCHVKKVPCHNDSLCENWVRGKDKMYLIDWEYSGMNDALWDLADTSIEANYSNENDRFLLSNYFEKEPDSRTWKHFLANKIYVDYLWTLWAKTRVPFDGQPMEDWASERYSRLKKNVKTYIMFEGGNA